MKFHYKDGGIFGAGLHGIAGRSASVCDTHLHGTCMEYGALRIAFSQG
jgi:hypothetical protein